MTKTDSIRIRLTPDEKKFIKGRAKELGQTVTDVILTRVKDLPVKDYTHEKQFFLGLHELTQQLQFIGNNINQAVRALHQLNNNQKIEQGEYRELKVVINKYMETQDELSHKLEKAFFR